MPFLAFREQMKSILTLFFCNLNETIPRIVADFSIEHDRGLITSRISSKDERVMNFYKTCGVKRYAKYYIREDLMLYIDHGQSQNGLKKHSIIH